MAWYRCVGNSLNVKQVLTNGQVSTTSNYATATLDADISDCTDLFLRYSYEVDGTPVIVFGNVSVSDIPVSGEFQYSISVPNPVRDLTAEISRTTIRLSHYSGAWRDIYCDIKGIVSW